MSFYKNQGDRSVMGGEGSIMARGIPAGLPVDKLVAVLEPLVTTVTGEASDVAVEAGEARRVMSVAMIDPGDIRAQLQKHQPVLPDTDLVILVGVPDELAGQWLGSMRTHPVAVMAKEDVVGASLRAAAQEAEVMVIAVDPRARWDVVLARIRRTMEESTAGRHAEWPSGVGSSAGTLSDLANLIADGVYGMVTIENQVNHVLAYSPSETTADELRTRAILGRAAPPEVMETFTRLGVVNTLASTTEVVSLPADPTIGMRRRLVTGIHGTEGEPLGSLWVQQGERAFSADAETLLRGGAVSAAALMTTVGRAPSSAQDVMVRRLFGDDGGVDGRTAGTVLRMASEGRFAVIGFAGTTNGGSAHGGTVPSPQIVTSLATRLQLHVRAFSAEGLVSLIDDRAYVLLPESVGTGRPLQWVEQLLQRFDDDGRINARGIRAAVASPVEGLDAVAAARREVDRVLDSPAIHQHRVTSLSRSRTSVLLGEITELLGAHPELSDPRLATVEEYDRRHKASLTASVAAYLRAGMNVRVAAAELQVHPNTLRYRVDRAQQISGLDLSDPGDRLLTSLQLEGRG